MQYGYQEQTCHLREVQERSFFGKQTNQPNKMKLNNEILPRQIIYFLLIFLTEEVQFTWCQAIALYQHLTGLGFQWWHDDRSGVPTAVSLWNPFGVVAVPIVLPCAMLHGVRAVVAGGIRVGGVMHGDTADDILPLLGQGAGGCMLLLFLFIRVAADGDDADGGAGGVGDDDGLPLPLPRAARGRINPAARHRGAAGRAGVHHGTAGRGVLLHSL